MIDTHAHLYSTDFELDREEMVARAKEVGVEKVYLIKNQTGNTITIKTSGGVGAALMIAIISSTLANATAKPSNT